MTEETILEILNKSELIRMSKKYFDSDTVEQGIEELKDAILEKINQQQSEVSYNDLIEHLKSKTEDYFGVIQVKPLDEENIYTIEVFLCENKLGKYSVGIVGDFGEQYEWDELEILEIIK